MQCVSLVQFMMHQMCIVLNDSWIHVPCGFEDCVHDSTLFASRAIGYGVLHMCVPFNLCFVHSLFFFFVCMFVILSMLDVINFKTFKFCCIAVGTICMLKLYCCRYNMHVKIALLSVQYAC